MYKRKMLCRSKPDGYNRTGLFYVIYNRKMQETKFLKYMLTDSIYGCIINSYKTY